MGQRLRTLGDAPFRREAMLAALPEFLELHRRLPILNNQWANVVRWELRPRLF